MDVRWVSASGVDARPWADVPSLLERGDGFVWIDAGIPDQASALALSEQFGFHALAVRDILERNHLPKIHAYPDHLFVVLHGPKRGESGHVHLIELDMFIGGRYLITTHGPLGVGVEPEAGSRETTHVHERLQSGRLATASPFELAYAIVGAMTHRQESYLAELASKVAALEQAVRGKGGDPLRVLDEMFMVRHELLAIRTMAAESREVFARMSSLTRMIPPEAPPLIADLIDRFERIKGLCEDEKDFAEGVIEFYQARTTTRMNIAMERLALIAAIVLPITAIASIYGMNIIVGERTDVMQLAIVLGLMGLVVAAMLVWSKRAGWW